MHPGVTVNRMMIPNQRLTPKSKDCVSLLQVYDLNNIAKDIELPGAFILGAGAASSKILGVNAEVGK